MPTIDLGKFDLAPARCGAWAPPGWVGVVERALRRMADAAGGALVVDQVKQKFGGLRIYYSCPVACAPEVDAAYEEARAECDRTCPGCGTAYALDTRGGREAAARGLACAPRGCARVRE